MKYYSIYKCIKCKKEEILINDDLKNIEPRCAYCSSKKVIEEDIIVTELFDVACCEYHLNILEAYWINHYDSYNNGYNNTQGNHITDDGIEEFNKILEENGLKFVDGKLIKVK